MESHALSNSILQTFNTSLCLTYLYQKSQPLAQSLIQMNESAGVGISLESQEQAAVGCGLPSS